MSRRFLSVLLVLAFFSAACTSEGLPGSYPDQDNRAERQFVEACEESLEGTNQDDVPAYCRCAFYTVAANLTFSEFLALDEKLRDDPGALSLEEQELLDGVSLPCAFTAADINTTVTDS